MPKPLRRLAWQEAERLKAGKQKNREDKAALKRDAVILASDSDFGGDVGAKRAMDVLDDSPLSYPQKRYMIALLSGGSKKECYERAMGKTFKSAIPHVHMEKDPAFREFLPIVQRAYLGESVKRLGDAGRLMEKLEDVRKRAKAKDDLNAEIKAIDASAKVAGVYGGAQDNGDGYLKLIKSLTVNNVQVNVNPPIVQDTEIVE